MNRSFSLKVLSTLFLGLYYLAQFRKSYISVVASGEIGKNSLCFAFSSRGLCVMYSFEIMLTCGTERNIHASFMLPMRLNGQNGIKKI